MRRTESSGLDYWDRDPLLSAVVGWLATNAPMKTRWRETRLQ
ncbi:MAG TPA: hypothetical protein VMF57_04375 [Solirubrobacteraceae bacterium]|nr:hypothetical protein [Solirubrobacteraceae bacterium]HTX12431.1 hypothetical protein [Solirubrobacteraceae bacterium]